MAPAFFANSMDQSPATWELKMATPKVAHKVQPATVSSHASECVFTPLRELRDLDVKSSTLILDGHQLTPAGVVSTARFGAEPAISEDPKVLDKIERTVQFLASKLDTAIYGVTTYVYSLRRKRKLVLTNQGMNSNETFEINVFEGSADTRTDSPMALQMAFLEHQLSGVLPLDTTSTHNSVYLTDPMANVMPEAITRGAILIRINSLVRGHSAVRLTVLETLLSLLKNKLTPMVPLRGSISASGDLMPLSYVAAAICGHPAIRILDRSSPSGQVEILSASDALAKHGITPIVLGPKEGLGISNGTAFSASAACLAAHDAHMLALLAQALTAMTTEAMMGQVSNFNSFIHEVCRPHPGQVEVAHNIQITLRGTKLAVVKDEEQEVTKEKDLGRLRQDRYPLRTSPQWLGPQIEQLIAVNKTLSIEVNSTTDNPLVDLESKIIHNGGNFQAMAITNAMENTRASLESIGKLSFAQATELINCAMNKGLPSCLAGDEPSTNYHVKGLDINLAAYTAELGFLASSVSSHVQSAEQHNQAVNSMALVSARYTIQAVEVLSMLLSAHLYTVCMAIDLRVIEKIFQREFSLLVFELLGSHFDLKSSHLAEALLDIIFRRLESTSSLDTEARFLDAFRHSVHVLLETVDEMGKLKSWPSIAASKTSDLYRSIREGYFKGADQGVGAEEWMSYGTRPIYQFVRKGLGIKPRRGDVKLGAAEGSVTSDVSKIYESLRSGEIFKIFISSA